MPVLELSLDAIDDRYSRLRVRERRRETQLMATLEQYGQQDAILVVEEGNGRYAVVDGHKRIRALKRLRRDTAKALVLDMPAAEALAAAYRTASRQGYNAIEDGWLVYELHRVSKWDLGKVGRELGRSKSWASRRLALVEQLPEWLEQDIAAGKLGAHAAANYLAPLTRGNGEEGRQFAEKLRGLGLSDRELMTICEKWRDAPAAGRWKITQDPMRFLKALKAAAAMPDPSLSEAENHALKQLELIGNVALGLTRNLPRLLGYDAGEAPCGKLWVAWESAAKRLALLQETAAALRAAGKTQDKEERKDAQSRNTDGDLDAARSGTRQPQDRAGIGCQPLGGAGRDRQRELAGATAPVQGAPA